VSKDVAEVLGSSLVKFDTDEHKTQRIMMAEKLEKRLNLNDIYMSAKLLGNLAYIYTESQQWTRLRDLLMTRSYKNCDQPSRDTVSYLKKNLMYCFDAQARSSILDRIDVLEREFKQQYRS